ncbi:hypothetical protein AGMMS49990_03470 [Endomicrobiia bacterium]|nr:hypothetical protein AGMMS49990_03470 [Endomicrobiia bacterium]
MKQSRVVLSLFALLLTSLVSCTSVPNSAGQVSPGPKNVKKVYAKPLINNTNQPGPKAKFTNVKKVYVKPFINNTNQPSLEVKFTNEVMNEIMGTGRLSLVDNEAEADGIIMVTIIKYTLKPHTTPGKYKLLVIADVSLIDKNNNATLWAKHDMEGTETYEDSSKNSADAVGDGMTEEEARQLVWEKMSKKIVRSVVKEFKSVTSGSEKKVPA